MYQKIERVCFVIDSPMNALVASLIALEASHVEVIYAFDHQRKCVEEYIRVSHALLSGLKIHFEQVIDFDSQRFWGGGKNDMLPAARQALTPLIQQHPSETVYFGNCLTNPVALALKYFAKVNHLYHAPGDFSSILFPPGNKYARSLKRLVKTALRTPLYEIEKNGMPLYSLIDIPAVRENKCLDYMEFESPVVEDVLTSLIDAVDKREHAIMLLLSGDEPAEPGDNNSSNIEKYIEPHLNAVRRFVREHYIENASIWLKEHKSYRALSFCEKETLRKEFVGLDCEVNFISEYLPVEYRLLPAECILRYCNFIGILGEPSATLFHSARANIKSAAIVSNFNAFRTVDENNRNMEYVRLNSLVKNKFQVY